ncbi:MAG: hypothetical protein ACRD3O_17440 [Terriglobia bacterium]
MKMILDDGSWVLMPLSGTEPVVRVYGEAAAPADLEKLMATPRAFVLNP